MDLFKEKDSEVIRVKNDDNKMEVSLDTSQYRPDELTVSMADGAVTIQGKHEEKAEDGTKMVQAVCEKVYSTRWSQARGRGVQPLLRWSSCCHSKQSKFSYRGQNKHKFPQTRTLLAR